MEAVKWLAVITLSLTGVGMDGCSILPIMFRQHYLLFITFQWRMFYVFYLAGSSLSIRFKSLPILTSYPQMLDQYGCHKLKLHQFYMIIFGKIY
jgi:hypothetical protein